MGTRSTKRVKNIKLIVLVFILIAAGAICLLFFAANYKPIKKVHFSIDDATLIFQDIQFHEYDSIFDNPILKDLKRLHDVYGVEITLYVFGELDDFAIWDMNMDYISEFRSNSDWLKIGFHSGSDLIPEKDYKDTKEFAYKFTKVERAIRRMAGDSSLSHVLRLHYWYASDDIVEILKSEGVIGLLCNDGHEGSYNLTSEQIDKINKSRDGILELNGITYYKTDIRLEKIENITEYLEEHRRDHMMVIFTHAWCYEENKEKMEEAVLWLLHHEYEFTDLYIERE